MAAFFSGAFNTGSFSINAFDFDVINDTHDGFDGNRKRDESEREAKDRLRDMLQRAIDPQSVPVPAEALEAAAPVFKRLESGDVRIDWRRIERENVLRAQLYAYAAEYERVRLESEAEEDDAETVAVLLWN